MYQDTMQWFLLSLIEIAVMCVLGGLALHWRGRLFKANAEIERLKRTSEWRWITPTDMPKVGDELLSPPFKSVFYPDNVGTVYNPLRKEDLRTYQGWVNSPSTPFTHFRAINPPEGMR